MLCDIYFCGNCARWKFSRWQLSLDQLLHARHWFKLVHIRMFNYRAFAISKYVDCFSRCSKSFQPHNLSTNPYMLTALSHESNLLTVGACSFFAKDVRCSRIDYLFWLRTQQCNKKIKDTSINWNFISFDQKYQFCTSPHEIHF